MTHYINLEKKRLCGRNNNTVPPLMVDYSTIETLEFQFINSKQQLQPLDAGLSGFYLAGSLKMGDPSCELLFLSKDFTIEDGKLKFSVDTYTQPYLRKITKKNTEINLEIGQIALDTKKVWLRDYALANPRVYVAGLSPQEIESNDFYTKEETQELVDAAEAESKTYTDEQTAATLSSANAYTDEQIASIDLSEYATDADLAAAKTELEGNIALKADESDLQTVSGAVDTNTGNIQTLSGDVETLELVVSNKAEKSVVDTISGDLDTHEADTTIHTTAAEKATWNSKLDASALDGYATEQYVDGQVSGKADQSALTAHTSDTEIHTTALEKAAWDAKASEADLQVVSGVVDTKLEAPSGGTAGQVLTKTADGAEWADAQDGKYALKKPDYFALWFEYNEGTGSYNTPYEVCFIKPTKNIEVDLKFSKDNGQTWTQLEWPEDSLSSNFISPDSVSQPGSSIWKILFKGNNTVFDGQYTFRIGTKNNKTVNLCAGGNPVSLFDETVSSDYIPDNALRCLFLNNTKLKRASKMVFPANHIGSYGYESMFLRML